jgi:hypothetical protein
MCAKHVEDPRTLLKIVNRKYADFKVYLKVRPRPLALPDRSNSTRGWI